MSVGEGMSSALPKAKLAREPGICCAGLALATAPELPPQRTKRELASIIGRCMPVGAMK